MSNLVLLHEAATQLSAHAQHVLSVDLPNGDPTAPSGGFSAGFGKIIGAARWIGLVLAGLALIMTMISFIMRDRSHEGGQLQNRLIGIGIAVFVITGAISLISWLVG
jgi:hypothetical protein